MNTNNKKFSFFLKKNDQNSIKIKKKIKLYDVTIKDAYRKITPKDNDERNFFKPFYIINDDESVPIETVKKNDCRFVLIIHKKKQGEHVSGIITSPEIKNFPIIYFSITLENDIGSNDVILNLKTESNKNKTHLSTVTSTLVTSLPTLFGSVSIISSTMSSTAHATLLNTSTINSTLSTNASISALTLLVVASLLTPNMATTIDYPEVNPHLDCIDYSTYRDNFLGNKVKPSDIDKEIKTIVESGVYCIRIFFNDATLPYILNSVKIHNEEFPDKKIMINPIIPPLNDASKLNDTYYVNLLLEYTDHIQSIVVGNGALDESLQNKIILQHTIATRENMLKELQTYNEIHFILNNTISAKEELRKSLQYNSTDITEMRKEFRNNIGDLSKLNMEKHKINQSIDQLVKDTADLDLSISMLKTSIVETDDLRENIVQIKKIFSTTGILITTGESPQNISANPDIVKELDYVTVLYFPFYETNDPDVGLNNISDSLDYLQGEYPDKDFFVVSGWPSDGIDVACTQASRADQNIFINQFTDMAKDKKISSSVFEAFDETWKPLAKLLPIDGGQCQDDLSYITTISTHNYGIFYEDGSLKPNNLDLIVSNLGIVPSESNLIDDGNQIILDLNLKEDEYNHGDIAVVNIDFPNFNGTMNVQIFNGLFPVYVEKIHDFPRTFNIYSEWEYDSLDDVRVEFEVFYDKSDSLKSYGIIPPAHATHETSTKPIVTYAILAPQFVCQDSSCPYVNIQDFAWFLPTIIISAVISLTYPVGKPLKKRYTANKKFIKSSGDIFYVSGVIDMVDFTKYTGSITSEDAVNLVRIFYSEMRRIIQNHDGEVIKKTGDGLLFYFNNTTTDDEKNFVSVYDCCIEISNSCSVLNKRLSQMNLRPIRFRLSLSYGPTKIITDEDGKDIIGNSVNLASQINHLGYSIPLQLLRLFSLSKKHYVVINSNLYKILDKIARARNDKSISFCTSGHYLTDDLHWHKIYRMEIENSTTKHDY